MSRRSSYVKDLETISQFNQMKGCLNSIDSEGESLCHRLEAQRLSFHVR